MAEHGRIVRLTRYAKKGEPGEEIQNVRLIAGVGMEGDFHSGERQISLLSLELRQWMDAQAEPGLCFRRYKENILFEGLPSAALVPGEQLYVDEAVLEISAMEKHCFDECPLFRKGEACVLAGQNLFAKVIKSGVVRVDMVLILII
ncbi:hypothetical protein AGMMS50293_26860 [Spirochaetia bacterium]|nr:hypothetical protein AGMMS50293_26860 [Spirochaetia bacterium]